jgi:decaprenylphospho-beta-D-ribofuranose 2-oxidase
VHARRSDLPSSAADPLGYRPRPRWSVPGVPPLSALNPLTISAFNEMWYRRAPARPRQDLEPLARYFYPLDGVGHWGRLYGRRGFTQYQFVVPFGQEDALRTVLARLSAARRASFLTVLKRFGPEGSGFMSFPAEGWTLALDLPLSPPGLGPLLDGLDDVVAGAGGRVYLAKDGRLRPELVPHMYPRLGQWEQVRARLDPAGTLASDLSRRLGIGRSGDGPRPAWAEAATAGARP